MKVKELIEELQQFDPEVDTYVAVEFEEVFMSIEWQPMATAPLDGTMVYLCIGADPKKVVTGYYMPEQKKWWLYQMRNCTKLDFEHLPAPFYKGEAGPTHWCSLESNLQNG